MARKKINSLEKELQRVKEDFRDLEWYIKEFSLFLPLAVCTVNPLKFIIDINQAFQNLTHYKPIEIVGVPLVNIFLEKKKLEDLLNKFQEKEKYLVKELTLISKEKKEIPVDMSVSIRKNEAGDFIGYFIALYDITETKKYREALEEKVKERTKELQERIEELERFQKLTVGREIKMMELKEEIKKLKEELEEFKGRAP